MSFLLLLAWGTCIFCAFLGYGSAIFRLFGIRSAPWALTGCTGLAFVTAIGGLLNLAACITPSVLTSLIVAGDFFLCWSVWRHTKAFPERVRRMFDELARKPYAPVLMIMLIVLVAIPVFGNVRARASSFQLDDLAAYLTFPPETLQLGGLPFDPFNERRITSCLGAPYFLQAFMLVLGDVRSIPFIDVSIGYILYAGVVFSICRTLALSLAQSLCITMLIFVTPVFRLNLTMVVLPAALFAALFWTEIYPALGDRLGWRRSVLLGSIAALLCSLKSNYLPPAVLICLFYYLGIFLIRPRWAPVRQVAIFVFTFLICIVPWMLDMKRKEGTYLFPILGRGYDASAYGVIPMPSGSHTFMASTSLSVWVPVLALAAPLFLAAGAALLAGRERIEPEWLPLSTFLLSMGIAALAVAASTGGEAMGRYTGPFQIPALLIFAAFILRWWRNVSGRRSLWLKVAAAMPALGVAFFVVAFGVRAHQYVRYARDLGLLAPPTPFDMATEHRRIAALQAAIPDRERMLVNLLVSFPFDFKRNRIFVADFVGMAGLPPGMPVGKGPDALRAYLLEHSIRYIAYDFTRIGFNGISAARLPNHFPNATLQTVLANPAAFGRSSWSTLQAKVYEDEQDNFRALAKSYKHVYQDPYTYVLDLESARGSAFKQ